jgi:hypothetical protein
METFEVSKDVARQIRWLLAGVSTDEHRGQLQGIKIEGKKMYSSNGFCLLIMDTPWQLEPYIGRTLRLRVHDKLVTIEEELEGQYPNIKIITEPVGEPVFKITIADNLLKKLIMPGATRHHFTFYGDKYPIRVITVNLNAEIGCDKQEAWIMPQHPD